MRSIVDGIVLSQIYVLPKTDTHEKQKQQQQQQNLGRWLGNAWTSAKLLKLRSCTPKLSSFVSGIYLEHLNTSLNLDYSVF